MYRQIVAKDPIHSGDRVDFAQLIKVYSAGTEGEDRYSPAEIFNTAVVVLRNPDPARIRTRIVERQNLTIRMQMRRLTPLTTGFSEKCENLWAEYCLHFAYYNFCRIHRTMRVTPAMESELTATVGILTRCPGDSLSIVRTPQEQNDFLEHGRFGEGSPSQIRTAFSKSVLIGFVLIGLGFLFIGAAVIFKIGRDDGGPLFVMGFFASLIIGIGCFLWALARKIVKTLRH